MPIVADKIVINHYYVKSREEFTEKIARGSATRVHHQKKLEWFNVCDRNDEFDDGILHYRDERTKTYRPPDKSHAAERLLNALMKNLSPTLLPNTPPNFYAGKMETFLTCRAVASLLKSTVDESTGKFFEETALKAILRSFNAMNFTDARIFLRELPNLLALPSPVVKDLRAAALQLIPQVRNVMHLNNLWKDYVELDYLQDILKLKE